MSLPQPSKCATVINRRLRAKCDAAWVSESFLATEFEHYCSISKVACRNGSSVPGPLESRRRLGKRNMGELYFGQTHASAPLWELYNAVDLSKWKWEPPRSASARKEQMKQQPKLWNTVMEWLSEETHNRRNAQGPDGGPTISAPTVLEQSALPEAIDTLEAVGQGSTTAPDQMPPEQILSGLSEERDAWEAAEWPEVGYASSIPTVLEHSALPEAIDIPSVVGQESKPSPDQVLPKPILIIQDKPLSVVENGLNTIIQDILLYKEDLSKMETMPIKTKRLKTNLFGNMGGFRGFCFSLQESLAHRPVSSEALCIVLGGIVEGLDQTLSSLPASDARRVADDLTLQLCVAVVDSISRNQMQFDGKVWSFLLHSTSKLRLNTLRLFGKIMSCIPDAQIGLMAPEIVANVEVYLLSMGRKSGKLRMRQVSKMAGCLQRLGSIEHNQIFDAVTQQLSSYAQSYNEVDFQNMRLSWLCLVARLSKVEHEFLVKTCSLLETGSMPHPLTQRQICQIFLGWLDSQHRSVQGLEKMYGLIMGPAMVQHDNWCYSLLSSKMWNTNQARYIRDLCQFLHSLGRDQDILHLLRGLRNLVQHTASPLANLALGLGHSELALKIHLRYAKSRWRRGDFWKTTFADESLSLLLNIKGVQHKKVLRALRVFPSRGKFQRMPRRRVLTKRDIVRTERAAMAFASLPNLSNRAVVEKLTGIVKYFQLHRHPVPPRVLRALLHVVIRDLAEGKPGRTTRMRWFIKLVRKESGPETALEVGKALKQWRETLVPTLGQTLQSKRACP